MKSITIFASTSSPKLDYALDFVFRKGLEMDFDICSDLDEFINKQGFKIAYSSTPVIGCLTILDTGYFGDFDLSKVPDFDERLEALEEVLTFDLFASVFYCLTRVEEYLPFDSDEHGRFAAEKSILHKKGLLQRPILDEYLNGLKNVMEKYYGQTFSISKAYQFTSTLDLDHLYAFKHKNLVRTAGGVMRDLVQFKWGKLSARLSGSDPFDRWDDIFSWHKAIGLDPLLFVLTAERSTYDRSISPNHVEFQRYVGKLSSQSTLGIHPSYSSEHNSEKIRKEKENLQSIIQDQIQNSRQHFLRLKFPDTYRALLDSGIKNDYSMGYPSQCGFRAGTSRPFYWYDLQRDQVTDLMIHPFAIMDVTLKSYLSLNTEEAKSACMKMIDIIKATKGNLIIIWHNSSFYSEEGWDGWEDFYKWLLQTAKA